MTTPFRRSALASTAACTMVAAAALLAGCAGPAAGPAKAPTATAQLKPTRGSETAGTVTFTQDGTKVNVRVQVSGLVPNQEHGFHVHEKGDCSSPEAMSAGGHFNPAGQPHGPQDAPHHGGDMPSLKADAAGNAQATFQLDNLTIGGGAPNDIVGRGVIVHAKPDDYKTQPTGNSGARLACGVIAAP